MNNPDLIEDIEWLAFGLQADAGYIAACVLRGDQTEATAYMRRVNYLERMTQWKAARGY